MIGLVAAAALACIPLGDADQFGDIGFDEGARPSDQRLVEVRCAGDECKGGDRHGVRYSFLAGNLVIKTVEGPGPSGAFREHMEASPETEVETLTAPLCMEASWVSISRGPDGDWTYGLYAQP